MQRNGLLILLALFSILCAHQAAQAQFSLPKQSKAVFSGQVVDGKTGAPLPDVTVFVRSEYGDITAKTDSAGTFQMEVSDGEALKKFLIICSHPDYREKDMTGLFNGAFKGGKARLSLLGQSGSSTAKVKFKKDDLDIACGSAAKIATKDGRLLNFKLECVSGRALTLETASGNVFTISGNSDIDIEVKDEKTKIEYAGDEPARFDLRVPMFRR